MKFDRIVRRLLRVRPLTGMLIVSACAWAQTGIINTVAGGYLGDGGPAAKATFNDPLSIAAGPGGVIYIADSFNHRIRRIDASGAISTVAGSGNSGYNGDGAAAANAELWSPQGVTVAPDGTLYIADTNNHRIRHVGADGKISTVAGIGVYGYGGDGGPATSAQLNFPAAVAVAADGSLYIADTSNQVVRRVGPDGVISTFAGTGAAGFSGDGGAAASAQLWSPQDVAIGIDGSLYIADSGNNRIRNVGAGGVINTVAGGGSGGDGGPAVNAQLVLPSGIAVGADGSLYIADTDDGLIRKVTPDGTISTVAGGGFYGDGSPANSAQLSTPVSVAAAPDGSVYLVDSGLVRQVGTDGILRTVAGAGIGASLGDGGSATAAQLQGPGGVAIGPDGSLYIADTGSNRVRVSTAGQISTVAGNGTAGFSGDGGPAASAQLSSPEGLAVGPDGSVYIADTYNHAIRRVGPDGNISTFAGNGSSGFSGDSGPASAAQLNYPTGVAVLADGTVYIADTFNHRIRRVGTDGNISTIAGTGVSGFSGDGGPAIAAQLNSPQDVALGADGSVYVADSINHRVRRIGVDGKISTFAGTGLLGFGGDGGSALNGLMFSPSGLAVGIDGSLYIADRSNDRVRRVGTNGTISTIAGTLISGFGGDGGLSTAARVSGPSGVAVGNDGSVYIADQSNNRIRQTSFSRSSSGTLAIVSGNNQAASLSSGFANPLVVKLVNSTGAAVSGSQVQFSMPTGSGTLSASSASTDSTGSAQVTVQAGSTPGPVAVTATAGGSTVIFGLVTTASSLPALTSSTPQLSFAATAGGSAPASQQISVSSSGGPVTFSVQASGGNWLQVAPSQGTTPATLTVTVDPTGLAANPYSGSITVLSAGANGPLQIPVSLSVLAPSNTQVTVTTDPPGLSVLVDGVAAVTPVALGWIPNSNHTVDVPTPQGSGSTRYGFDHWSQGGTKSQTIIAPGVATTYTASMLTQYLLTSGLNPSSGGALAITPASADGFYTNATAVTLNASPAAGYTFSGFSGDVSGSGNPQVLSMTGPKNVTANFTSIQVNTTITVDSNPPGRTLVVDNVPVTAPAQITWAANTTHTISAQSPQGVGNTRYSFSQWSNGGSQTQTVSTPSSPTTYLASFTTQQYLTMTAVPSNGGTIAANPASPDGFYNQGTSVQVTAAAGANFTFQNFTGDLTGSTNPQTIVVSTPKSVQANFAAAVPLTATPPSLSFTAAQGSNATSTLQISGGTPGQTISISVDKPWLLVNPSQGTIPFTANVVAASSGLATGTFTGTVTLGGTLPVPVNFVVNAPAVTPQLVSDALAAGLQFTSTVGSATPPAAQNINLTSSDGSEITFSATVNYGQGPSNWVTLSAASGQTPGALTVGINPASLTQAGAYTAVLAISSSGSSNSLSIPVTLNYNAASVQSPIQVSLQQLSLSSVGTVKTSSVVVQNSGSSAVPVSVSWSTDDNNNWLSATPVASSVSNQQPTVLQVTADPTGLATGTYTGTVQITDSANQTTPVGVLFAVNAASQSAILESAVSGISFTIGSNYKAFPPQSLELLASGTSAVTWTATSPQPWISISPAGGTIQPGAVVSPMVTFDLSQLCFCVNNGTITIHSDAVGGDLTIPVQLNRLQNGTSNLLQPDGLVFLPPFNPVTNVVYVPAASGTKLSITPNMPWLKVQDISSGQLIGTIHTLQVSIDSSSLQPGTQVGAITIQESSGVHALAVLQVLAYMPATGGSNGKARKATDASGAPGCTASQYISLATSFSYNINLGVGPSPTEITIVDDCGNPVTTGVSGGVVGNGDPQLNLLPLGDGRWKSTWNPTVASPNSVQLTIAPFLPDGITLYGDSPVLASASLTGTISGPVLDKNQPFQTQAGVALPVLVPDMQFSIIGKNFLNSDGSSPGVLIGGNPATVVSATDTQLLVLTPADLPLNVQMQLIVQGTGGTSVPQPVIIAPSWPAVSGDGEAKNIKIITGLGKIDAGSLTADGVKILKVERVAPGLWKVTADGSLEKAKFHVKRPTARRTEIR